MTKHNKQKLIIFEVKGNGEPVTIHAFPYWINEKLHFRVNYNDSPIYIFGPGEQTTDLVLLESSATVIDPEIKKAVIKELPKYMVQPVR